MRVAQAQVEACEDELSSRAAELDELQVTQLCTLAGCVKVESHHFLPTETRRRTHLRHSCVQARLAEAEDALSAAKAQTAAVHEESRQSLAAVQAEAQAAAARARKVADAEIGAARAEGAAAAGRARQEADSAVAEVRAGAEGAAARAKQEADSSAALIR